MKITEFNLVKRKHVILMICLTILLVFHLSSFAQEQPPKPIAVTARASQQLSFGTFIQSGTNGTVSVTPQGVRSSTGSVILISSSNISPALIDVVANPGTLITITNGSDASLTSSEGSVMTLHIGDSDPGPSFIASGTSTPVKIGGTLIVGSSSQNPPGIYSGTFQVNFIQQ